jgi:hypothetical protein
MPRTIQIRDLDDDVYAALQSKRARRVSPYLSSYVGRLPALPVGPR